MKRANYNRTTGNTDLKSEKEHLNCICVSVHVYI